MTILERSGNLTIPQTLGKDFMMTHSILRKTERLRQTAMQLRQQAEQAEAWIAPINEMLDQVGGVGLIPETVILGKLLHAEDRSDLTPGPGIVLVYQAALVIPGGIGVLVWDAEDLLEFRSAHCPDLMLASMRFVEFDELQPVVKALLLLQIKPLYREFFRRLPRQFRPRLSRVRKSND